MFKVMNFAGSARSVAERMFLALPLAVPLVLSVAMLSAAVLSAVIAASATASWQELPAQVSPESSASKQNALPKGEVPVNDSQFKFVPDATPSRIGEVRLEQGLSELYDPQELLRDIGPSPDDFAWLGTVTFGDANSRTIAVAVHRDQPERLWVDFNRDRHFAADEFVDSPNQTWTIPLQAEYVGLDAAEESTYEHRALSVQFRYDRSAGSLSLRTAGAMEGTAIYLGQPVAARIEDRNANGCWFDPEDRLFVDLNRDGQLDKLLERLAADRMQMVGGKLVAISGDRRGDRLELFEVTAKGQLIPTITLASEEATIESFSAIIASSHGSQFRIDRLDSPIELPVGNYRVYSVDITLRDQEDVFRLVFRSDSAQHTIVLPEDGQVSVDLLGRLRPSGRTTFNRDDNQLVITPNLRSDTNLYLMSSRKGRGQALSENGMTIVSSSGGKLLGATTSGFS